MTLTRQQSDAIEHLKAWRVGALFMEAGTGKTRVAVDLVNSVEEIDFVLWVAPLRTIKPLQKGAPNVIEEVGKWGGFHVPVEYVGIESIQSSSRIYLGLLERVKAAKKVFIVVDESLKIKNMKAVRTNRLLTIGRYAAYKLILNGTPLSRNLLDLYPQMLFLSPKILNMTENQFKNTFCNYTQIKKNIGGKVIVVKEFITGYENIDYLYSLIRHYVYECDLTLNITQNYHTVNYELAKEDAEEYYRIKGVMLSDEKLSERNNNIFIEMTQKMQHAYCCTSTKFTAIDNLFAAGVNQKETVIFCKFVASRQACEMKYPKCMVLSYQREAFGLNLQEYSNTIYFDKVFDYALRIQSNHRTFRIGQEKDCQYYDLTGNVGLEKLIDKNIEKKISMTEYFKSATKEQIQEEL